MTSATAKNKKKSGPSAARLSLDIALGKKHVNLGNLKPDELRELLREQLDRVDYKELTGFTELGETLSRDGDEPLGVSAGVTLDARGFQSKDRLDLKTHTVSVTRGLLESVDIYRHGETGDETSDYLTYSGWGEQGYLARGSGKILLLRRMNRPSWEKCDPLVLVKYHYEKVPREPLWLINRIEAVPVPISRFNQCFKGKAPSVASDLIWELSSIYDQTLDKMRGKLAMFEKKVAKRKRLSDSIYAD